MPLSAATMAACFDGRPLGLSQTATRFRSAGTKVAAIHFLGVAAFAAAEVLSMGEVREDDQSPELLTDQSERFLLFDWSWPAVGKDVLARDDEDAVVFELAEGWVDGDLLRPTQAEELLGAGRTEEDAPQSCMPCSLLRSCCGQEVVIRGVRGDDRPRVDVSGQVLWHSPHQEAEDGNGLLVVPNDLGLAEQFSHRGPGEMIEVRVGSLNANSGFSTDEVVQQVIRVRGHGSSSVVIVVALVSVATG